MGKYNKTSVIAKGCPVFEQVEKQENETKFFLFVGPGGCWRVGPDVASYSGSVLKHPKKNVKTPPKSDWLYYLDNKWHKDEDLQLIMNENEIIPGGKPKPRKGGGAIPSCCTLLDEYDFKCTNYDAESETEYTTTEEFKHITCLQKAILSKDIEAVKASIEKGCNINFEKTLHTSHHITPLIMACQFSTLPIVTLLVKHPHIDLDRRPYDLGENALSWAVRHPEGLDMVKLLVESGANVQLRDNNGCSSLHWAVDADALECVKYLYSVGASVNTHSRDWEMPLNAAVFTGNIQIVRFLITNGATIDYPKHPYYGFSPFHYAVRLGHVEIIKYMISEGADVTLKGDSNYYGEANLEIAKKALEAGNYDWVKYEEIVALLKSAEKLSLRKIDRNPNMEESILHQYPNPKITQMNYLNISSLGVSILQDSIQEVMNSLKKACDINFSRTEDMADIGYTPLMLACEHSSLEIVKLLLKHPGIDIDEKTKCKTETALNRAVRRNDNLDMVKALVEAGADPDMRCRYGYSILQRAIEYDQLDTVKYLQSKGAWIDSRNSEKQGGTSVKYTPLWLAAHQGRLETVKYLVSQGANIDEPRGWNDHNPLNAAVAERHLDVVKYLIEQGADIDEECEKVLQEIM